MDTHTIHYSFHFFKGEEVASLKISIPVAITNGLLMPHMLFC